MHSRQNLSNTKRSTDTADRKGLTAHLVPNTINTMYSAVPWYLGGGNDSSMGHQMAFSALKKSKHIQEATKKVQPNSQRRLKRWHPGCCNNCGADSHKTKDCVELPRKIPAKQAGIDASCSSKFNAPIKPPHNETRVDESLSADLDAYAQSVLFNPNFRNSCAPTPTEHSGVTMRQYDDMPAYLKEDVLSYDPRTHAVKHDRFKVLEGDNQQKSDALRDARLRLDAIKKFELIGEAGLLPSALDAVYRKETPAIRDFPEGEATKDGLVSTKTLVQHQDEKNTDCHSTAPMVRYFSEGDTNPSGSIEKEEYVPR